jgi:hypothetical protein
MQGENEPTVGDRRGAQSKATESDLFGLLTPDQLSAQLNVTPRTLQRWHALRIGPSRTVIGRQVFFQIESVRIWLTAAEQLPVRSRSAMKEVPTPRRKR